MKSKKMTFILFLIFLTMLIFFFLPLQFGIINIGNITGTLISGLFAVVFLFPNKSRELIQRLCSTSCGKTIFAVAGGLFAFCLLIAIVISGFMIKEMNDKPKTDTTVVVLGCQVRGTDPSLMLRRRLNTAYDYLTEHENIKVIVSGGQGEDEAISEAQCMYNYLVSKGISPDRIYIEDKSVNTSENIAFSKQIIEKENLCSDITIVTDGFHQLRADMFAKEQGIKSYNLSANTPFYLVPTYWVREWFGILYYKIF